MTQGPITSLSEDEVLEGLGTAAAGERALRADAARLVGWAEDTDVRLQDRLTRASLLVMAAGQLGLAGAQAERLALVDRAVALGDDSGIDLRIYRVDALLAAGREDDALAEAERVRRSRPSAPFTGLYLADLLGEAGHHARAERWYNIALRQLEDADPETASSDWDLLLLGRRRVRRAQGKAPDAYDADAEAVERLDDEGF